MAFIYIATDAHPPEADVHLWLIKSWLFNRKHPTHIKPVNYFNQSLTLIS